MPSLFDLRLARCTLSIYALMFYVPQITKMPEHRHNICMRVVEGGGGVCVPVCVMGLRVKFILCKCAEQKATVDDEAEAKQATWGGVKKREKGRERGSVRAACREQRHATYSVSLCHKMFCQCPPEKKGLYFICLSLSLSSLTHSAGSSASFTVLPPLSSSFTSLSTLVPPLPLLFPA